MSYEIGKKYTFDVKEIANANGNQYYIIDADGKDCYVKMYEFQKGGEKPRKITCIYKAENRYYNNPVFMQDVAPILHQLYEIGKEYKFRVKKFFNNSYYVVEDNNGFNLYLTSFGDRRLYENQIVKCRVTAIKLVRVELELINTIQIDFLDFSHLLKLSSNKNINSLIATFPEKYALAFKDVKLKYEDKNALWVINAIETIDNHLAEWLTADDISHKLELLKEYHYVCIRLLENSGYFKKFSDTERMEYQLKISNIITHAEDFIKAYEFIAKKTSETFIADILDKLSNSGYIYNPEENMRVIMCIFTLDKDAVQEHITRIFDIVIKEHANKSFMTLFSNAFVQMLESYIVNESTAVNKMFNTEDVKLKAQIKDMIKAIAILLLLKQKSDFKNFALYHSMLYRYASLIANKDADKLMDMAFSILFAISDVPMIVTWKDIDDVRDMNFLCGRLLVNHTPATASNSVFEGKTAMISVKNENITISPVYKSPNIERAFADDLMKWHNVRILLNERLNNRVSLNTSDIDQFRQMWIELDRSLFNETSRPVPSILKRKVEPSVGNYVFIRIIGMIDAYTFSCVIDDEEYTGKGSINLRDIVGYNLFNITPEYFKDSNGDPLVFEAEVKSIDSSGDIEFSMKQLIAQYLADNISAGTEVTAKITGVNSYYYLCITTDGYTISISKQDNRNILKTGDVVNAVIENVGEQYINASFTGYSDAFYDMRNSFKNLLDIYGQAEPMDKNAITDDGKNEEGDIDSDDNVISDEYAQELIHLVDTHAMMEKDYIKMYNYLALAKVMCHITDKYDEEEYFVKRMELVRQIKYFEKNEKINEEQLNELLNSDKRFIDSCPDIKCKLTQLEIINSLGKENKDDMVWAMMKETGDSRIKKLARLALSYNMLDGLNAYDLRKSIVRQIFQIMDLNIRLPQTTVVATEDEFTELKSSMVYPADNHMKPDLDRQLGELVEIVCSFMNSKGGTLYVGVNNLGTPIGLNSDFIYLNNNSISYDEYDMQDKFNLIFRNKCKQALGVNANGKITSTWVNIDDKWIYKVDVEPSGDIVTYKNTVYVRQGTSSWALTGRDLVAFRAQRNSK